jgi:hypothetical protein
MAMTIPITVRSYPGLPPTGDLVGDVFAVTQDGVLVRELDRFPIVNGAGVYNGPALPSTALRWGVRIRDYGAGGGALFRSGPLRRLPGRGPFPGLSTRISIFRTGGTLTLDEGDGLPEVLLEHIRAGLVPPMEFAGAVLGVDDEGRYQVTVRGRLEIADRLIPFTYRRDLRLTGGLEPGRSRQAGVAQPEGVAQIRGANVRPYAAALDAEIVAAAEEQLVEVAFHITRFSGPAQGLDFAPTTVSITSLQVRRLGTRPPFVYATLAIAAGAVTGGVVPQNPPEPPVASPG